MKTPTNYNCPICKDGTKIVCEESNIPKDTPNMIVLGHRGEWNLLKSTRYLCPQCRATFAGVPDKEPQKETPRTLKVGDWVECTGQEKKYMRYHGQWFDGKWPVENVDGDCGRQYFCLVNDPWTNRAIRTFDNRYRIVDTPEEQSCALPKFESVEKLRANEEAVVFISSIVDADSSESKYHRDYVHALLTHDRQTEKRLRILAEFTIQVSGEMARKALKQAGLDPWPEEWK